MKSNPNGQWTEWPKDSRDRLQIVGTEWPKDSKDRLRIVGTEWPGKAIFTLEQSQPNHGGEGEEEDDEFLTLKQGHLFLISWQSQFLLILGGGG